MSSNIQTEAQLKLTVANARVKWMFGTQSRSTVTKTPAGAYVPTTFRAPEKWYIFCASRYLNNNVPPSYQIEYRSEIPVLEIPNDDEWWDTNTGKAVNKKDLKFDSSRGVMDRSVTTLMFHDATKINNRLPDGKIWEMVTLDIPFIVNPTQKVVIRAGALQLYGYNFSSLVQF